MKLIRTHELKEKQAMLEEWMNEKVKSLMAQVPCQPQYNEEIERMKILNELLKEQIPGVFANENVDLKEKTNINNMHKIGETSE